jgi:hypothetical protein
MEPTDHVTPAIVTRTNPEPPAVKDRERAQPTAETIKGANERLFPHTRSSRIWGKFEVFGILTPSPARSALPPPGASDYK